ncbi:MAG: hypothetical protein Q8Q90_03390 [bacterium]|nr:hypothetical protein [bacterium]
MDYDSQKGPVIDPYDTVTSKTKEKIILVIGAVVLIGAAFYFIFSSGSPDSNTKSTEVKLIDQTIKEVEGVISSIDTKANTFVLAGSDSKEYTVATFPETMWDGKKDSILKKDTKVRINFIDAQKSIGMLYAANIEKIK